MNDTYLPNGKYNLDNTARYKMTPPDEILAKLCIKPDMVIVDIGAGTGFYTESAAKLVPQGHVYALEVSEDMLSKNRARCEKAGLNNITYQIVPEDTPKIGEHFADVVLFAIVCHEIKDRVAYLIDIKAMLKPEGRVLFMEWINPPGPPPHNPARVVTRDMALEYIKQADFSIESSGEHGDFYSFILK